MKGNKCKFCVSCTKKLPLLSKESFKDLHLYENNNNFHVESVKVIFLTKLLTKTKNRVKREFCLLKHVAIQYIYIHNILLFFILIT